MACKQFESHDVDENGVQKWDDLGAASTRFGPPAFVSELDGLLLGRVEVDNGVKHDDEVQQPDEHADEYDEKVGAESDEVGVVAESDEVGVVGIASNFATKSACSFRLLAFCDPCQTTINSSSFGPSACFSWPLSSITSASFGLAMLAKE